MGLGDGVGDGGLTHNGHESLTVTSRQAGVMPTGRPALSASSHTLPRLWWR